MPDGSIDELLNTLENKTPAEGYNDHLTRGR